MGTGSREVPDRADPDSWTRRALAWWRSRGGATQGLVPGLYAWAVTVAPVGVSRGASTVAAVAAGLGLVPLALGPVLERRSPYLARLVVGWGLVVFAIASWVAAPQAALSSFDAPRGVAGMLGWGLFAFVIASPARPTVDAPVTTVALLPRLDRRLLHTPLLVLGVGLALVVQIPGWHGDPRERALLVRLVGVAAGLGLITVASAIASGHTRALEDRPSSRTIRVPPSLAAWIAAACALLGFGVTYALWSRP